MKKEAKTFIRFALSGRMVGGFAGDQGRRYIITMMDPLSPLAGLGPRLALAGLLVAVIWLGVAWALAA